MTQQSQQTAAAAPVSISDMETQLTDLEAQLAETMAAEPPEPGANWAEREATAKTALGTLAETITQATADIQLATHKIEALKYRASTYKEGECPECGQHAASTLAYFDTTLMPKLESDLAEAHKSRDEAQATAAALRATLSAWDAERQELACAQTAWAAKVKDITTSIYVMRLDIERATVAQQTAKLRAERDAIAAAAAAQEIVFETQRSEQAAQLKAEREQAAIAKLAQEAETKRKQAIESAQNRIAIATAKLEPARAIAEQAKATVGQAAAQLELAEGAVIFERMSLHDEIALLDAEIRTAEEAARVAQDAFTAAHAEYTTAHDARTAADAIAARKRTAEEAQERAKTAGAFWRSARVALTALERQIFAGLFAPITQPVNDLIAAADAVNVFGKFTAQVGDRFRLGFEMPNGGFAPLSRLSDGHLMVTMFMIAAAIYSRTNPLWRAVTIDRAEAVDSETRGVMVQMLVWLVNEGYLDQVLIGAVDAYDWGQLDAGLSVVDLRECVNGAEATARVAA